LPFQVEYAQTESRRLAEESARLRSAAQGTVTRALYGAAVADAEEARAEAARLRRRLESLSDASRAATAGAASASRSSPGRTRTSPSTGGFLSPTPQQQLRSSPPPSAAVAGRARVGAAELDSAATGSLLADCGLGALGEHTGGRLRLESRNSWFAYTGSPSQQASTDSCAVWTTTPARPAWTAAAAAAAAAATSNAQRGRTPSPARRGGHDHGKVQLV
jgi:hypothetical protein